MSGGWGWTRPGWYPDPASPFALRWWDGERWTNDARPAGPALGPTRGTGGLDPYADLAREAKAGGIASQAVLWGADGTRPKLVIAHSFTAFSLFSNLITLALLVIGVLFVSWLYQAATLAQRAGVAARHQPVWAIVGWIVPVVSVWFPYQSTVDLFPPGHPARAKVGRWWALWLVSSVAGLIVLVAAWFSAVLALAFALAAAAVSFGAAFAARDVIAEVNRAHARRFGR